MMSKKDISTKELVYKFYGINNDQDYETITIQARMTCAVHCTQLQTNRLPLSVLAPLFSDNEVLEVSESVVAVPSLVVECVKKDAGEYMGNTGG